jgi:triphosphoribosyl-dephospho-CoA synthetase
MFEATPLSFAGYAGGLAALATFEEALLSPKPGLVGPDGTGSHADMNWTTLLLSASALAPFWRLQALEGLTYCHYKPLEGLADKLRATGLEMERAMFRATDGVNTHKGLIFALSLILGASGVCFSNANYSPRSVLATAGEIIAPLVRADFERIRAKSSGAAPITHGEKIFLEYGVGGIRSEASRGFPSIPPALAALEDAVRGGAAVRDAALAGLLELMAVCEDTNVIHRGGVEFWRREYRERAAAARKQFDPCRPGDYGPLLELNELLVSRGVSPGGAADLLVCTLFLYRSKIPDIRMSTHQINS